MHKTRDDILSVIDLLPNVTEELGMVDWKIHDEDLELLQHNLDQLYPTVRIINEYNIHCDEMFTILYMFNA